MTNKNSLLGSEGVAWCKEKLLAPGLSDPDGSASSAGGHDSLRATLAPTGAALGGADHGLRLGRLGRRDRRVGELLALGARPSTTVAGGLDAGPEEPAGELEGAGGDLERVAVGTDLVEVARHVQRGLVDDGLDATQGLLSVLGTLGVVDVEVQADEQLVQDLQGGVRRCVHGLDLAARLGVVGDLAAVPEGVDEGRLRALDVCEAGQHGVLETTRHGGIPSVWVSGIEMVPRRHASILYIVHHVHVFVNIS